MYHSNTRTVESSSIIQSLGSQYESTKNKTSLNANFILYKPVIYKQNYLSLPLELYYDACKTKLLQYNQHLDFLLSCR